MATGQSTKNSTVNESEINHFAQDSHDWWNETGPFAPLHRLNPVRLGYIKSQILDHFDTQTLKGLSILDVGCGGGLICEPLTRLGATVTGADADAQAIETAELHAAEEGISITYLNKPVEDIDEQYDVVLALEIIEHVNDPQSFIQACTQRVKPGGMIILSTLNRTPKAFALGIVMAEYVMRWVPRGTHHWQQFQKPSDLARYLRASNFETTDVTGLTFNSLEGTFALNKSKLGVNYLLSARPVLR